MKKDRALICSAALVAILLAGCDTSTQSPATPATSPTSIVMTSQPAPTLGADYPAPDAYPAPTPAVTAYPAPTSTP